MQESNLHYLKITNQVASPKCLKGLAPMRESNPYVGFGDPVVPEHPIKLGSGFYLITRWVPDNIVILVGDNHS